MAFLKSVLFFIAAGFCEIGGGYLVWLWLKEGKPVYYGVFGFILLALYGVVATQQTENFGRTYATYGGVFIIMSIWWGWKFKNITPDKYDIIGALIAIVGVAIIMYAPRK